MESQAKLVIIGAGIVGCSAAYHLTRLGWRDIVVIDQGKRPSFGGSSSHAPGGMFQTNGSKLMTEMAHYGVHFYDELVNGEGLNGAMLNGGIEFARTPERLAELHRRCTIGHSWGLDGVVLSPQECKEKVPFLDEREVLGGYYVGDDGVGRIGVCTEVLVKTAEEEGGVKFYDQTDVLDIETSHHHVDAVVTSRGRIECEYVLCCAGFWGPLLGEMVGQPIPLLPMEHQYVVTEDLRGLSALAGHEHGIPILRDQDHALYFRQHWGGFGIGNYSHRPIPIDARDVLHPREAPIMPSMREFTPEDFTECWDRSSELFPMLAEEQPGFVKTMNGIFSFTPDGGSFLGESLKTRGFWVAEAIWFTHAAGFAKAIAEWMDAGEPQQDLHEADLNRIYDHWGAPRYIHNRAGEAYRTVYAINHPQRQPETSRHIARSPIFDKQRELGAVFFDTMGYDRAHWYQCNESLVQPEFAKRRPWLDQNWSPIQQVEALHTREKVALYELSAFQLFEISGPGALGFLQYHTPSQVDRPVGRITYSHLMTDRGGVKSDITISRMDEDTFWVISGVGSAGHDWAHLRRQVGDRTDVRLHNRSSEFATLGIWGPDAPRVVQPLCSTNCDIRDFKFFTWRFAYIAEVPCYLLRISYVGEAGWEIYTHPQYLGTLWERLEQAGRPYGILPAGGGAFNSLRIEKSYRSWGGDMAQNENPFEVGTDFVISWKKGDFLGRDTLARVREDGPEVRLCTFRMENPTIILQGSETVYDRAGRRIGYVTSADYGYAVDASIGFAYLAAGHFAEGTELSMDYFGRRYRAFVTRDTLYDPHYEKIRPARPAADTATPTETSSPQTAS